MTRLAQTQMDRETRAHIARLVQLHRQTHPARIAGILGVTANYVQRIWAQTTLPEMPSTQEALEALTVLRGKS